MEEVERGEDTGDREGDAGEHGAEAKEVKKRSRFHDEEDVALMQKICRVRPFAEPRGAVGPPWERVANGINS